MKLVLKSKNLHTLIDACCQGVLRLEVKRTWAPLVVHPDGCVNSDDVPNLFCLYEKLLDNGTDSQTQSEADT